MIKRVKKIIAIAILIERVTMKKIMLYGIVGLVAFVVGGCNKSSGGYTQDNGVGINVLPEKEKAVVHSLKQGDVVEANEIRYQKNGAKGKDVVLINSSGETVGFVWSRVTETHAISGVAVELTEKLLKELNVCDVVLNKKDATDLYEALGYYFEQFSPLYSGEKIDSGHCYSLAWLISNAVTNMQSGNIQGIYEIRESYSKYFDKLLLELNVRIMSKIGIDSFTHYAGQINQASKGSKEVFMLYVDNLNKDVLYPYFKSELKCDENKLVDRTLAFCPVPSIIQRPDLETKESVFLHDLQLYFEHLPTMAAYNLTVSGNFDKLKHSDVWGAMDCMQGSRMPRLGKWPYKIWYLPLAMKNIDKQQTIE